MSVSNIELRQKHFGRASDARNKAGHENGHENGHESGIGRIAALSGQNAPQTVARTDFFTPALGLAALFAAIHALLPAAPVQGDVLGLVNGMRAMIASFALPALLVLCGIQAKASLGKPWLDYISETITPFAIALIAWALFVGFAGLPAGGAEGALANIHAHMKPVSILMAMPVFLILAKLLRGLRPVGVLFLAAFAEILHTNSGHFLIVDLLRGGVFFFGGVYFASYAQIYARFAQERPGVSAAGLLIWLAFLTFVAFGHHHLAHGEDITTLPFTSLGLGAAGVIAVIVCGQLLAQSQSAGLASATGRRWLACYVAYLLAGFAFAAMLQSTGYAIGDVNDMAIAALLAALAVAALSISLRRPKPREEPAQTSGFYSHRR